MKPRTDNVPSYYARYFADFAPGRPYLSLILSIVEGSLAISGRVFWKNCWLIVEHTAACDETIVTWPRGSPPQVSPIDCERVARVASAFGEQAIRALRSSSAAVIGAGGTGSAAIEILARAGVGRLILVDPDVIDRSNLERVHGSTPADAQNETSKVLVAAKLIRSIDPSIVIEPWIGRLPQKQIVDAVVRADVMLGCTDQQHSRLALSDLALRYLIPSIDCGVIMEGGGGHVSGQIAQFVRFLPADPCALCRDMIVPNRIKQELMSEEEKNQRRRAADEARERGDDPNPYWHNQAQINTVGYLTTAVGAMIAGYAIGWLTKRFSPPFERLQINFVAKYFDVTDLAQRHRPGCACTRFRGWASQANADALISAPEHWPLPQRAVLV